MGVEGILMNREVRTINHNKRLVYSKRRKAMENFQVVVMMGNDYNSHTIKQIKYL